MDEPSRIVGKVPDVDNTSQYDIIEKIKDAFSQDSKDEFLHLSKGLKREVDINLTVFYLYIFDSVKCAAAVLANETNGRISLTCGLTGVGWTPLHESAVLGAVKITSLLLEFGYSANARADWESLNLKEQLPLNVALQNFRSHDWVELWAKRKSAVRLVMELCALKNPLETVRLLALNTLNFKHEFYNYVKEGKMNEVGAILIVAGQNLMPLSISEGADFVVFNRLGEIRHFLLSKKGNSKLAEMKGMLLLLDIFDRIGDKLRAYVRLNQEACFRTGLLKVASLIEAAGFDVKTEDIYIRDYLFRVYSSPFEWKILQNRAPQELDRRFCRNLLLPSWMRQKQHLLPFCGKSRRPSIPNRHLFHTSCVPRIDSNFASSTRAKRPVNVVPMLNTCKWWAFLMETLQKGFRHV